MGKGMRLGRRGRVLTRQGVRAGGAVIGVDAIGFKGSAGASPYQAKTVLAESSLPFN
jgi:hypothetical protein